MKCIYCRGEMERRSAPFHVDRKGYHLVLDEVPAWVCRQCGEAYFADAEVSSIQEAIKELDRHTARLSSSV